MASMIQETNRQPEPLLQGDNTRFTQQQQQPQQQQQQ